MYISCPNWHTLQYKDFFGGNGHEIVAKACCQNAKGIFAFHGMHNSFLLWYDVGK